jgi:hypothetical protein
MKRLWIIAVAMLISVVALGQVPMTGAGLSKPTAAGGGCAAATTFLAATSGLSGNYQTQYTNLICGLNTDGVLAKLDTLYVFKTNTIATAKLNLVQRNYDITSPNGDPTFTANTNIQNPSNKYFDSHFDASTATSPNFVQNSACMFNWNTTNAQVTANGAQMGLVTGGATSLTNRDGSDLLQSRINTSTSLAISNADASGLWLQNRTSSSNVDIYHNGASFAAGNSNTSAAVQSSDMTFFVGSNFDTVSTLVAGGWGGTLSSTDVSNLNTRLNTFLTNVP